MKYQQIYDDLIDRARGRKRLKSQSYERHHILPRCLGGNDHRGNLTYLTLREHFIAHLLLCKIYPAEHKLAGAVFLMKSKTQRFVSSKTYDKLKQSASIAGALRKQAPLSAEARAKISIALKVHMSNPVNRAIQSAKLKGKNTAPKSAEHKAKISKSHQLRNNPPKQTWQEWYASLPPMEED